MNIDQQWVHHLEVFRWYHLSVMLTKDKILKQGALSNDRDDSSRNVAIGSSINLSNKNDFCFWSWFFKDLSRFKMRSLKIIPEDNLEMNKGDQRKNRDLINELTSRKCGKSRNISSISNFLFLFAKELRKTCFRRLSAKSLWVDLCIIYTNY